MRATSIHCWRVVEIATIERDELKAKLDSGADIRLVMSLQRWAFEALHIPGSLHLGTPEGPPIEDASRPTAIEFEDEPSRPVDRRPIFHQCLVDLCTCAGSMSKTMRFYSLP